MCEAFNPGQSEWLILLTIHFTLYKVHSFLFIPPYPSEEEQDEEEECGKNQVTETFENSTVKKTKPVKKMIFLLLMMMIIKPSVEHCLSSPEFALVCSNYLL